eukprot:gene7220-5196_t
MGSKKRRIRHADTKQLDKDDEEHSIKSYVIQQLNKFFVQHLPMESLKEFPPSYMYYAGTVAYMVMIATFVYFTFQSYLSSVQQAFIALDPSSGDCTSVSIAISNTYLADTRGNWVGTPHFTYSLASYSLTLNNFQADSFDDYETMMNTFHTSLDHIGEVSVNHSLAYNLVLWTSWIRYYSTADPSMVNFTSQGLGQLQYLQMTGEPAVIFNANRHQAVISSQYGLCGVVGYTSYDMANARVMTEVNYTYYSAQPLCMVALQPQLFGYIASVDNNIFTYGLDVNAFVTAMAVNYGILQLQDLGIASQTVYRFTVDGNAYVGQQYFDLRYPYMTPILCVRNTTSLPSGAGVLLQRLCFVLESEAVTLPLYDHFGVSYRYPIPCRCGAANQNAGSLPPCQVFNMLASLLYYVPSKGTTSIQELIIDQLENLLQIVYGYESYSDFTLKGFNASWSAAAEAYGRRASETLSPTWQKNAFGFCALPSGKRCSLMTFNSYNAINRIVSEYKYQLSNGSCANTFTGPSNATGTATGRTQATSSSSSSSSNPMHDDVETGAVRARKAPKLVFRIIAHEGIPHDCMILNALDRGQVQHISRKPIKDFKPLVQLLDDLSKQANVTFTDYDTNPRGYEVTEDLRRPETSLFHLTALSMRLLFVEFDYFLRLTSSSSASSTVTVEDVTMVMVKLSNILRLHASVMLQISLKDMETYNYVGKVGYNLGGRYVTVPHLLQLMAALSEGGPA